MCLNTSYTFENIIVFNICSDLIPEMYNFNVNKHYYYTTYKCMIVQKDTNLPITLVDTTVHSACDTSRRNVALVCIVVCRETRQT